MMIMITTFLLHFDQVDLMLSNNGGGGEGGGVGHETCVRQNTINALLSFSFATKLLETGVVL